MQIPFHLVDVFADQPLTGNPLAVVPLVDIPSSGGLDDITMRNIARELQQAETTFLLAPAQASADWRLRSFTVGGIEVFGAGHNALGAWWWLAESGLLPLTDGRNSFTQEIGERLLPVEIDYCDRHLQSVILTQAPPMFGNICEDLPALALALGLHQTDLADLPVQAVSTGASHLLVPIRNRAAIERAVPDTARLARILENTAAQGCYLFSLDPISPQATAHARFFNPTVGLFEDAATGSAAGPLACQLIALGIAEQATAITIEQGYEMGRPSVLQVHVNGNSVRLSGRCIHVAYGILRIH